MASKAKFSIKASLHFPESNVLELKRRYGSLYVPSDFFLADHLWNSSYPVHRPCRVGQQPSAFHVFSKDLVDPVRKWPEAVFDPPDADYSYCVKVMLLATPGIEALYETTCNLADSGEWTV